MAPGIGRTAVRFGPTVIVIMILGSASDHTETICIMIAGIMIIVIAITRIIIPSRVMRSMARVMPLIALVEGRE
jgi:hypothetical protein